MCLLFHCHGNLLLKCFVYMCMGLAGFPEQSWDVKARPSLVLSKQLTLSKMHYSATVLISNP